MKKLLKITLIFIITVSTALNLWSNTIFGDSSNKMPEKGFTKVAVGFDNMLALHKDGCLWETPIFQTENAVKISDKVAEIDGDENSFYMIKKDGTLWTWSSRDNLNDKSGLKMQKPVKILNSVKSVASSGNGMVTVLKRDNSVWMWLNGKFLKVFSNAKNISSGYHILNIIDLKGTLYRLQIENDDNKFSTKKIADSVAFAKGYYYIKKDNSLIYETSYLDTTPRILKNVIYTDSYIAASCAIKKDGSLWAWNIIDDNIPQEIAGSIREPVKIMDSVIYADCCYERIVAVKKDGSICAWGGISPLNHYSIPRNVMGNAKMIYNNNYDGMVLCTDNSLWYTDFSLERSVNTKILSDVDRVEEDEFMQGDDTIVKKDGIRWYLGWDSNRIPKTVKYPDGTIKVVEDILIMKDGSLMKDFKKFGSGIKDVSELYCSQFLNNVYILEKDGSFWVVSKNASPDGPKELQKPLKLADGITQVYRNDSYVFALNNKEDVLMWNIAEDKFSKDQLQAKTVLSGIKSLNYNSYTLYVIKNDKSIWLFDKFYEINKNTQFMRDNLVKVADNSDEIRYYNSDYILYKDGRLFVNQDVNNTKLSFKKIMDNVKDFTSDGEKYLVICKDNSLWEFGSFISETGNAGQKKYEKDLKPKKVLNNIKECWIESEMAMALSNDGKLYTWGDNANGGLGYDKAGIQQNPLKVMEGIVFAKINAASHRVYAINNKGYLYQWGAGFFIGHEQPYTRTPLNINTYSKTPVIRHQSYAAARTGEIIDILVKITQPDYKHVNVILSTGTKVKMKPCAAGYYEAQIISRSKSAGHISYKIQASNSKGFKAETEFYNVQLVGDLSRSK